MIFHHLLTTPEPIEKPHKHLGSKETALLDNYKPIPQIDSAILRTCRLIYAEALPILYGQNTFEFSSANAIRSFQSKSLVGYPLGRILKTPGVELACFFFARLTEAAQVAFNLKLAPMGRLTLLRSVIINLNAEYRWHSPIGVNGTRSAPNRDHIWRDWYVLIQSTSETRDRICCKRQPMPNHCLSVHIASRTIDDSGVLIGPRHYSTRATTYALGAAEAV